MDEILTPADLQNKMQCSLNKLLDLTGNNASWLAKLLKVSPQVTAGWVKRGRISKEGAVRVSCVAALNNKIDYKELRPDIDTSQFNEIRGKVQNEFKD